MPPVCNFCPKLNHGFFWRREFASSQLKKAGPSGSREPADYIRGISERLVGNARERYWTLCRRGRRGHGAAFCSSGHRLSGSPPIVGLWTRYARSTVGWDPSVLVRGVRSGCAAGGGHFAARCPGNRQLARPRDRPRRHVHAVNTNSAKVSVPWIWDFVPEMVGNAPKAGDSVVSYTIAPTAGLTDSSKSSLVSLGGKSEGRPRVQRRSHRARRHPAGLRRHAGAARRKRPHQRCEQPDRGRDRLVRYRHQLGGPRLHRQRRPVRDQQQRHRSGHQPVVHAVHRRRLPLSSDDCADRGSSPIYDVLFRYD